MNPATPSLITSLVTALDAESAHYERLMTVAETQRQALLDRDSPQLTRCATEETTLLDQARELQQQGRDALQAVGDALGLSRDGLTLSAVIGYLDSEAAAPLLERRDQIAALAERLAQANRTNAALFENALDMVRFTLDILTPREANPQLYASPLVAGTPEIRRAALLVDQFA